MKRKEKRLKGWTEGQQTVRSVWRTGEASRVWWGGRERAHERGVSKNIFDAKGPGQELGQDTKNVKYRLFGTQYIQ